MSVESRRTPVVCSHRRWSDLFCSRPCSRDFHQTLDDGMHLRKLITAVVKETIEVESSKQTCKLACCPMTTSSKSKMQHLTALATHTEYPAIQEDPDRRRNREEEQVWTRATDEEKETATSIVSRPHVEFGHCDPRGMIDSLRREQAASLIIAAVKKIHCSACDGSERRRLRPVPVRVLPETCSCLQMDVSVRMADNLWTMFMCWARSWLALDVVQPS